MIKVQRVRSSIANPRSTKERILKLALQIRNRFDIRDIDDAATRMEIFLARMPGSVDGAAGFAHARCYRRPRLIESLANPGTVIRTWASETEEKFRSIILNTRSLIPEAEIFWHEWYHLFYSPDGIQGSSKFEHRFLVDLSDRIEERRADEFAAAVLIPSIEGYETLSDIVEQFQVSERLAAIAVGLYRSL